jgi:hypothetical protein
LALVNVADRSIIVWRRVDQPGLEYCELTSSDARHDFGGIVVGVENGACYRVKYAVQCDLFWHVREAAIDAVIEGERTELVFQASSEGAWKLSGQPAEHLSGCQDLDLGFTPVTNTIALRRLNLLVGASGSSRAAYVAFPGLTVSTLEQTYRRLSADSYHYRTDDGSFENTLRVSEQGLVISYPPFWEKVASVAERS